MLILAIDPGSVTHGYVLYDPRPGGEHGPHVVASSKDATTEEVIEAMHALWARDERWQCVVERVMSTGGKMKVKLNDLYRTAEWSGYFMCEAKSTGGDPVWMPRREVLKELHIYGGGADSAVRTAMVEIHGGSDAAAVGKKASPGPCYGVTAHAWQALGVAVAWWTRYGREGL